MASTQDDVVVRLRLKDVRQFIADVKSGKLAIEDLEKQVRQVGRTAARESSSSGGLGKLGAHFGMLAGFAKTGALALGAATVGVAGYAVKSAASMQQVSVSMETMLGSAAKARTMMAMLQKFARDTPFEFGDVAKQAQHLLAFGFAANSVKGTLTAVGNAASGLGLGAEGMDRIVVALGQMRAKGRVQGDEMLQLTEAGINANTYLERAFHLTPAQLQKAQQAGKISAASAIPVILKGMDDQFKGLMDKQSHTLGGVWSNLHDSIQQGLVRLTNPLLPTLTRWVGQASDYLGGKKGQPGFFDRLSKFSAVLPGNVTAGRSSYAAYNVGAIIGTHRFDPAIEKGVKVVHNLGVIVKDVLVPALKDFSVVLAPVVLVLEHLDSITGFVADHSTAFHVALDGLVIAVGAYKLTIIGVNLALKAQAFWTGIAELATTKFTDATNAQKVALVALKVWQGIVTGATKAWTAAQWLLNFAMDANPIGAVILLVGLIATGIYLAYTHSETFRKGVQWLWDKLQDFGGWIKNNWQSIAGFLLNPFQALLDTIHGLQAAWGWLSNLAGGGGGTPAPSDGTPPRPRSGVQSRLANGGTVTQSGLTLVGERGPEVLNLGRGSQVIPLPRTPQFVGAGRGPIHVHVMVDKREIAQAVYDDMGDRVARR